MRCSWIRKNSEPNFCKFGYISTPILHRTTFGDFATVEAIPLTSVHPDDLVPDAWLPRLPRLLRQTFLRCSMPIRVPRVSSQSRDGFAMLADTVRSLCDTAFAWDGCSLAQSRDWCFLPLFVLQIGMLCHNLRKARRRAERRFCNTVSSQTPHLCQ